MAEPAPRARAARAISVTRLVGGIQASLGEAFPGSFWLEGEVSNFRGPARGGHLYFSLKDDRNQVSAVVWASNAARLGDAPSNGMAVLARVRKVDFYGPGGRLSVQIDRLEARGAGELARRLEENRRRFQAEGLFDAERKRPLPVLPRTIGIVTARGGAVIHDILRILDARFSERAVLLRPVAVQGPAAAGEIADAIDDLGREGSADVLIVGRGGGSAEDLAAFSEEAVVRAIARSRIPVVSAVGHESDSALSDFVADRRAETPTAAAAMVVPVLAEVRDRLEERSDRLERALRAQVKTRRLRLQSARQELRQVTTLAERGRERLDRMAERATSAVGQLVPGHRAHLEALRGRLAGRLVAPGHRAHLEALRARLAGRLPQPQHLRSSLSAYAERLDRSMTVCARDARQQLEASERALSALSPLAVLDRGFTLTRDADGRIVRDSRELNPGDEIDLRFARGTATARVLGVGAEEEPE